jgi:transcriptional regulator with XRE-family HTH domain
MGKTKQPANVVGKLIQERRCDLGWTQEELAAKCQLDGLDFSRATVSQIEALTRCVSDSELLHFAVILGVSTDSLYPPGMRKAKRKH